jgi:glutathione-independent formaldehyde dehydrogenase
MVVLVRADAVAKGKGDLMLAVVLTRPRHVSIKEVAEPQLQPPTDVVLRLSSTAICGTDLHIYEGRLGGGERMVIGHEPLGVGDRVTVPTHICGGFCPNCVHGYSARCLTTNPGKAGAAYSYPGMGGYTGARENKRPPLVIRPISPEEASVLSLFA